MTIVAALPSRSDIATVSCWWSCFSSCGSTSLKCSVQVSSQPAFKRWLKMELFLWRFPEVAPTDLTNLFFICNLIAQRYLL